MDESMPVDHACVPCGHVNLCGRCVEELKRNNDETCPTCRATVGMFMKVFV
jgi:hypothetical protein